MKVKVKVINKSNNPLPEYETLNSAGMDVRAFLDKPVTLWPGERIVIPTGLYMEIPVGYEIQTRSRSGLAAKRGIIVLVAPGTIDSDYRGELGMIILNTDKANSYTIENGDRIGQLVLAKHERAEWEVTDKLSKTERGSGGYGSTGVK